MTTTLKNRSNWKGIQEKTFVRWCNSKLKDNKKSEELEVKNLSKDFNNGIVLIRLLESLSGKKFDYSYFKTPKHKMQSIENISLCFEFLKKNKFKIVNVDPFDIHDGNYKLTMGFVWTLIKSYDIRKDKKDFDSDQSLYSELLEWTKNLLRDYGYNLDNFFDWGNGMPFAALIHALNKQGIEGFDFNVDENILAEDRVEKAMQEAEEKHFIPKLMEAKDFLSGIDKLSNMTVIAMIKNEYENGPESRHEKMKRTPVAEKSLFILVQVGNKEMEKGETSSEKVFNLELRCADGSLVENFEISDDVEIIASAHTEQGTEPLIVEKNITKQSEGVYKVVVLNCPKMLSEIKALYCNELIGSPIVFNKTFAVTFDGPNAPVASHTKVHFSVDITSPPYLSFDPTKISVEALYSPQRLESPLSDLNDLKQLNFAKTKNPVEINILEKISCFYDMEEAGIYEFRVFYDGTSEVLDKFRIDVQEPVYEVTESGNNWSIGEKQILHIRTFDSNGRELETEPPKSMVVYSETDQSKEQTHDSGTETPPKIRRNLSWVEEVSDSDEKRKIENAIVRRSNQNGFEVVWVPSRMGRHVFRILSHPANVVLFEKKVDVVYSNQTLYTEIKQEIEDPVFEKVSTARLKIQVMSNEKERTPVGIDVGILGLEYILEGEIANFCSCELVNRIIYKGQNIGEYIALFSTNTPGFYEIFITIDKKRALQNIFRLKVEDLPIWRSVSRFEENPPFMKQTAVLEYRNESGLSIEPENKTKGVCVIDADHLETPVRISETEFSSTLTRKVFEWTPQHSGRYRAQVFLNEEKIANYDNILISNKIDFKKSCLVIKTSRLHIKYNIRFEIHLKDSSGNLIDIKGDEPLLSTFYGIVPFNKTPKDAAHFEKIKQIICLENGIYGFAFSTDKFAFYSFTAFYDGKRIGSEFGVKVYPRFQDISFSTKNFRNLTDDNAFFDSFIEFSSSGTRIRKVRRRRGVFVASMSTGMLVFNKNLSVSSIDYKKHCIPFFTIESILKDKNSDVLKRMSKLDPGLCFSVVTKKRSFDFVMNSMEERDIWVRGLELFLRSTQNKK